MIRRRVGRWLCRRGRHAWLVQLCESHCSDRAMHAGTAPRCSRCYTVDWDAWKPFRRGLTQHFPGCGCARQEAARAPRSATGAR